MRLPLLRPLGYRPDLVCGYEGRAPAPFDRAGTEPIDREELLSSTEPGQDCRDLFKFGPVFGIRTRKHLSSLLELVSKLFEIQGYRAS